jgi:sugar (pentulose or hexulose) kinase
MKTVVDDPIWIGIDLGTQSVRVVAVSANGTIAGSGSARLTSQRDGARHEQDPDEWWSSVANASRAALADIAPAAIRGLAVDGTSGTILLTDRDGNALTPGLMYDDTRATGEAQLANRAGAREWAALGYNRMQPAWGLPKLLWLLRAQPDLIAPGTRLAHQTDFINHKLIGRPVVTDTSNALKTGCHLLDESWPHEVFNALGVPPSLLPPLARSGTPIGTVCAAAAALTGIPEGTPVIAGMTDGCASQIGAGALSPGSWNSVLGTTLVLKGVTPALIKDPNGIVYSPRSPDGHWLPGGASSTGAGALTRHFPDRDLDALDAQAALREPASVIAYPLAGHGERFPFHAPDAESFILGEPADEIDHYAALLQGIAFIERLCFDYLDLLGAPIGGELRLTGGGAKSRYWCQLRADVLGRPVALPEHAEAAVGMAVLAASVGRPLAETAGEMVRIREVIDPRPGHAVRFHEAYLRLVDELTRRGWVSTIVARHAHRRLQ